MLGANTKANKPSFAKKAVGVVLAVLMIAGISSWSNHLRAADSNVQIQVCPATPSSAPIITSPANGATTTDSSVLMSGSATPGTTVYAYHNNTQVGFVSTDGTGVFSISVGLTIGTNELKASTNNDCGEPTFSAPVTVVREAVVPPGPSPAPGAPGGGASEEPTTPSDQQPEAPAPETSEQSTPQAPDTGQQQGGPGTPAILNPQDGMRTADPSILVTGQTSPFTVVRILRNGQVVAQVVSDDQGYFTARIVLQEGANQLVVATGEGKDARSSKEITVTYTPVTQTLTPSAVVVIAVAFMAIGSLVLLVPGTRHGLIRLFRKRNLRKPSR